MLNMPGMDNVKTSMAMHDDFSRFAGGLSDGQQFGARDGFAIGSHCVTIGRDAVHT
jgi:hypothetical protein